MLITVIFEQNVAIISMRLVKPSSLLTVIILIITGLQAQEVAHYSTSTALKWMESDQFSNIGINGQGVKIAVIDAGFAGTPHHPYLEHLFLNHQIAKTWNFIKNDENVFRGHSHGTSVLSCIAGLHDTLRLGMASGATFFLAATEMRGEFIREEKLFAKAVRWAIDQGVDIIHSSLGYTWHRYFTTDLNGETSLAAQAVKEAVSHGILFVNSAGNEGNGRWHGPGTPADASGIISVGGLDPGTFLPSGFSSRGPTADGRLKPEVVAAGTTLVAKGRALTPSSGTSFAAPQVTGFAACAWQYMPGLSAGELIERITTSAHLYPYYDYAHGYGVPMASRILKDRKEPSPTFYFIEDKHPTVKIDQMMVLQTVSQAFSFLYYKTQNREGIPIEYGVMRIDHPGTFVLPLSKPDQAYKTVVHLNGYTQSK